MRNASLSEAAPSYNAKTEATGSEGRGNLVGVSTKGTPQGVHSLQVPPPHPTPGSHSLKGTLIPLRSGGWHRGTCWPLWEAALQQLLWTNRGWPNGACLAALTSGFMAASVACWLLWKVAMKPLPRMARCVPKNRHPLLERRAAIYKQLCAPTQWRKRRYYCCPFPSPAPGPPCPPPRSATARWEKVSFAQALCHVI